MSPVHTLILFSTDSATARSLLPQLVKKAAEAGFSVKTASCQDESSYIPDPDASEIIVSVGGDGTFLRAAAWAGDSGTPIVGINAGHLGFLANYSADDISPLVEDIRADKLVCEPRELIKVKCKDLPSGFRPFALNEVAILKEDTSSMITVHTRLDDFFLNDYLADGLLISTSTGSTAYNLSAGGPIIQPGAGCWTISPIAPHTLTMRPLIVSSHSKIEACVSSRAENFRLSLDGRSITMRCGSPLEISKAPFNILCARRPGDNFASTLRKKLMWGRR